MAADLGLPFALARQARPQGARRDQHHAPDRGVAALLPRVHFEHGRAQGARSHRGDDQGQGHRQRAIELGGGAFLGDRPELDDQADAEGLDYARTPGVWFEADGRLRARQRRHRLQRARRALHARHVEALRANSGRSRYADVQHLPCRRTGHPRSRRSRQGPRRHGRADRRRPRRGRQEAHVLSQANQIIRRRRHHFPIDADEGRLSRRSQG